MKLHTIENFLANSIHAGSVTQHTHLELSRKAPMKSNDKQIMEAINKIQNIFDDLLNPKSNTKITNEQFIEALAIATINTSNQQKDGLGIAILQTFVFDLQDFINSEIYGANQSQKEVQKKPQEIKSEKTTSTPINSDDTSLAQDSILSRMGYSVTEGAYTSLQRQTILTKIYKTHLPQMTAEDAKRWGDPASEQRLQAIARFLYWLHSFQGKDKPAARKKWAADLSWLKENYYNESMNFSWPIIESTGKTKTPNAAFMTALQPSKELAEIVGPQPLPRTEVISKLWIYIKKNKLQDNKNIRLINSDEKLLPIFKKEQVTMFELAGLIGKHLR